MKKKLYYHRTDGGAEYLMDRYILTSSGTKEGIFKGAEIVVRIDGDAEINLKEGTHSMATVTYSPYLSYVATVSNSFITIHTEDGTKAKVNPRKYRREVGSGRISDEVTHWLTQYLHQYYPQVDVIMTKVGKQYVATRLPITR